MNNIDRLNEIRRFLANRKVFVQCYNEVKQIDVDSISEYMDKCTVYGSIDVGSRTTPTLIIEFDLEIDRFALDITKFIVDKVLSMDYRGLYIVLSQGRIELRIHEESIPWHELREYSSESIGQILIENILNTMKSELTKISSVSGGRITFRNGYIDKLLLAPLTRYRNSLCIYIKPEDLDRVYTLKSISSSDHNISWSESEESMDSEYIRKIISKFRDRIELTVIKSSAKSSSAVLRNLGRFEVMAILQAARYYVLTHDLDKAKSFGLNRAIFYAWLKHYGRAHSRYVPRSYAHTKKEIDSSRTEAQNRAFVLGEEVFVSSRGWFEMGGQEQFPEDFDRVVKRKVDAVIPFEIVWKAAIEYVKSFPENILLNQHRFYKYVYEPIRDSFFERVVVQGERESLAYTLSWKFREIPQKKEKTLESESRTRITTKRSQKLLTEFIKSSNQGE